MSILPLSFPGSPLPWLTFWPCLWPLSKSAHSFLFPDPIMLTILPSHFHIVQSQSEHSPEPSFSPVDPHACPLALWSFWSYYTGLAQLHPGKTFTERPWDYCLNKDFAKSPRFGSLRLYTLEETSSWIQARHQDTKPHIWIKGISWITVTEGHWLVLSP